MRSNSQEIGLEAAILERVRNSSLVEYTGTDNVSRLKHGTDALESSNRLVGERSVSGEA